MLILLRDVISFHQVPYPISSIIGLFLFDNQTLTNSLGEKNIVEIKN